MEYCLETVFAGGDVKTLWRLVLKCISLSLPLLKHKEGSKIEEGKILEREWIQKKHEKMCSKIKRHPSKEDGCNAWID